MIETGLININFMSITKEMKKINPWSMLILYEADDSTGIPALWAKMDKLNVCWQVNQYKKTDYHAITVCNLSPTSGKVL